MTNQTPGQYLLKCRLHAKVTQTQLAEALGVTEQAISSWERGIAPMPKERIAALRTHVKLSATIMLDLMTAEYRSMLVQCVRRGLAK